jgi:hypothetical protein
MHNMNLELASITAVLLNFAALSALPPHDIPSPPEILTHLRKAHPRLQAVPGDFEKLKQRITANPLLSDWSQKLRERADRLLSEPPSRYEIPDGLRLLSTSRRVMDRTYTLALMYRLEGNRRYVERAWQELEAAAHFTNWNPRHFLDTAEMTHAFAIGYDWLYDIWTPEQRAVLREAIIEKGLTPALSTYRGTKPYGSWPKLRHNWNQVCNGGIGMGALAIGDEAPELAGEILHDALESIQIAMGEFAPDGAWNEGPGYWNYATSYNVCLLAVLDSALGTDFGLSQFPAFADTGLFPLYLTGPIGRTFNYADGSDGAIHAWQMFWLARKFNRPLYAWYERQVPSPSPLDVFWFDARGEGPKAMGLPLDKYYRGVEVAILRSEWENRDAIFVAFKAGDNKANHSHLDLGTFVLDALGKRWAVDLGADDYNLPNYFGKARWNYYRLRAEGHNTLLVNPADGPDQEPSAASKIIRFDSTPARALAIADLTPAYAKRARKVYRGISLLGRKQVLVQDEVQCEKPAEVWWSLHTPAQGQVSDDGASAMLRQGDVRLSARILSPKNATFTIADAAPLPSSPQPPKQAKNGNVRKLTVHLSNVTDLRLAILLTPLRENESVPEKFPAVGSLEE